MKNEPLNKSELQKQVKELITLLNISVQEWKRNNFHTFVIAATMTIMAIEIFKESCVLTKEEDIKKVITQKILELIENSFVKDDK